MGTGKFLEVEAKFAVDDATRVPDLTVIEGVQKIASDQVHNLSAVYYDTEDLRLTFSKITLRRRTGGKDAGWHIKLPAAGAHGRIELRAELGEPIDGEYHVPVELVNQIRSIVRDYPLVPIAQVDNERHETVLAGEDGEPVAEFCDDHITAWSLLPGGRKTTWREWEIELSDRVANANGDFGSQIITRASRLFVSHGARVSASPSKLVAALGSSLDQFDDPAEVADLGENTAAQGVLEALKANRDRLVALDPQVRRDEWDSVHQMRVATRELRSHMQTFEGILTGDAYSHLEQELKLLAGILGAARDAEVVAERFHKLLATEDEGTIPKESRDYLLEDIERDYRKAHQRIVHTLDSQRYLDMLAALDEMLANPPLAEDEQDRADGSQAQPEVGAAAPSAVEVEDHSSDDGEGSPDAGAVADPAGQAEGQQGHQGEQPQKAHDSEAHTPEEILASHLEFAYEKLVSRHNRAVDNWENYEIPLATREDYFHSMRKAAKRLRYSAEAAGKATNLKTKKLYAACKTMQSVLGDFQDAVTSRDILKRKARSAHRQGVDTFGYGILYQREKELGLEYLEDYAEAMADITKAYKKLRKSMKKAGK